MSTTLIKMQCNLLVPESAEVSADMGQKWSDGLTINATRINERRKAKIADDGSYQTKVSGPSNAGWKGMIDSGFVSRRGRVADEIIAVHAKNGANSFKKWNANLDYAFATQDGVPAKNFVSNVANKLGNWEDAAGAKTLRMTGDKIRGRGPSAILPQLLVGYGPAMGWIRQGDEWILGLPTNIVVAGQEGVLKSALTQLLTRAGLTIIANNYLAAAITAQNTHIATFLTAIRDATICDEFDITPAVDKSSCVFVVTDNTLTLNTVVRLTTP